MCTCINACILVQMTSTVYVVHVPLLIGWGGFLASDAIQCK